MATRLLIVMFQAIIYLSIILLIDKEDIKDALDDYHVNTQINGLMSGFQQIEASLFIYEKLHKKTLNEDYWKSDLIEDQILNTIPEVPFDSDFDYTVNNSQKLLYVNNTPSNVCSKIANREDSLIQCNNNTTTFIL